MDIQEIRRANLQRLAKETSPADIARRSGRQLSQICDVLARRRAFGEKLARRLEPSLGLEDGALDIDPTSGLAVAFSEQLFRVPLLAWSSVASSSLTVEGYIISEKNHRDAFALRIEDESMSPIFHAGDIALFERAAIVAPGRYVLARVDKSVVLRRYRQTSLVAFELVPENADFPTIKSSDNDITIIAVMVESRKYW